MIPLSECIDILSGLYQRAADHYGYTNLGDYESYLRSRNSPQLRLIEERCCEFMCFMRYCLRTENVYNTFYERFGCGFVFMASEDFDGFDGHECNECRPIDPLFVLIGNNKFDTPEHNAKRLARLRLENELLAFYKNNTLNDRTVRSRNIVIEKISDMLYYVWPNLPLRVDFFGSTKTGLASDDSDLDLTIVYPQYANASRNQLNELASMPNTVFNMHNLARHLRNIGMVNVLAIQNANVPICKFTDPETDLDCDINATSPLGLENSKLISEYIKMDKRVGPFLYALKYFVKQRNINDNQRGTLSSYAYCLLGLHFLMTYKHDSPIIPNIQKFQSNSGNCYFGNGCKVWEKPNTVVESQHVVYHTCVEVVSQSNYNLRKQSRGGTRWEGYCTDSLGEILLSFFKWFSDIEHLTEQMSILYAPFDIPNPIKKWFKKSMVIQDPFLQHRNVAQSCTEQGLNRIQAEFERAAALLEDTNMTFIQICNSNVNPQHNNYSNPAHHQQQVPVRQRQGNRNRNRRYQRGGNRMQNNNNNNNNSNNQNNRNIQKSQNDQRNYYLGAMSISYDN